MSNSSSAAPEPAIGVGAIVIDEQDRILLIQRNKAPAQGLWSIPGGKQEPGETLVAACEREIWEETGIAVTPYSVIAVVERIIQGFHYVIIDFLAALTEPGPHTPIAASDVSAARWVERADLQRYPLVQGLAEIIERVQDGTQGGYPIGLIDVEGQRSDFIPGTPDPGSTKD